MTISVTGSRSRVAAEVARLSELYHVTSESDPEPVRGRRGVVRVRLEVDLSRPAPAVLVAAPDAQHLLAALYALAETSPQGLDPISAQVAARLSETIAAAAGPRDTVHDPTDIPSDSR